MSRIDAVLIGAGQRGADCYAPFALRAPERLRFVAVVEPNEARRSRFSEAHQIPPAACFADAHELFALGRVADAALICTPDRAHFAATREALGLDYHVLLEKPLATTAHECAELVALAKKRGRRFSACHGLRHTHHFQKLKELLERALLGPIVFVEHHENVAYWHMAHSYVRGNWRSAATSAPMILAKCCHDFDLLNWLLDDPVERLTSHGSLRHFRAEYAPSGAPERCTDGCPAAEACPYHAPRLYGTLKPLFDDVRNDTRPLVRLGFTVGSALYERIYGELGERVPLLRKLDLYHGWPRSVLSDDPTPENIDFALRTGPYGRCVYRCDNDVVDHQAVIMELRSGAAATLHMHGHAAREERVTVIHGAHAELTARLGLIQSSIEVKLHASGERLVFDTTGEELDGHGGCDLALVEAFVAALSAGDYHDHGQEALESHILAFAAENARSTRQWIDVGAYRAQVFAEAERQALDVPQTYAPPAHTTGS